MKFKSLGNSNLSVSHLCLGSMTWGSQNTQDEAHAQIDMSLDHGVNFIDTAEMYPTTPGTAENVGDTERFIGNWFEKTGRRSDVILATKVSGEGCMRVREGAAISGATIRTAIEGSLQRLKTDYIDLYQLHWANRGSYHMRQNWQYEPSKHKKGDMDAHVLDVLQVIGALKSEGKIREFGLSNETVWGTSRFLQIARENNLPVPVSMQNEYSLLCRHFDLDFAELCHHEDVDLLAWSPLAAGLLSAKYENGDVPKGSRRDMQADLNKRANPQSEAAVAAYAKLARENGMAPEHLALAFCAGRPFCGSTIIGATNLEQLASNLAAADTVLGADVTNEIDAIRRLYPTPM